MRTHFDYLLRYDTSQDAVDWDCSSEAGAVELPKEIFIFLSGSYNSSVLLCCSCPLYQYLLLMIGIFQTYPDCGEEILHLPSE